MHGTVVAVGVLDRSKEDAFKATEKMVGIQSLNNFEFSKDDRVKANQQYLIGTGEVMVLLLMHFMSFI